ncbi:hypothetical protein GCM10020367_14060 [Streptomyces sannanensis]|uniref:Uncharacterized protein n=1 Tax=Streptomyces sannanensis TaxID=285536 RepID=A0ABP6S7D9_9ACTN
MSSLAPALAVAIDPGTTVSKQDTSIVADLSMLFTATYTAGCGNTDGVSGAVKDTSAEELISAVRATAIGETVPAPPVATRLLSLTPEPQPGPTPPTARPHPADPPNAPDRPGFPDPTAQRVSRA